MREEEPDREIDMASLYIGETRCQVSLQNAKKPETRTYGKSPAPILAVVLTY
jgi:hypothetical protein